MSHPPAQPLSRRERPAKPALTRAGIIAAGLEILESEGIEKVTMRRIAAALDTGAASLYVYVQNTADLHAQLLDELLADVRSPEKDAPEKDAPEKDDWRSRLMDLLDSFSEVLFAHPEIARMSMSTQTSGPNYLRLVDGILGLLREGGVSDKQAAWGVDCLLAYPTFIAAEQGSRTKAQRATKPDLADLATGIASADPDVLPNVAAVGLDIVSGSPAERRRWGIAALITGIEQTPRN